MKALWETLPLEMPFFTKLRNARYNKELCIAKVTKARLEEKRPKKFLEFQQVQLHLDPQNKVSKAATKDSRAQLQFLVDTKVDGYRIRSRTKWMEYGDRMNK